ncbi:MAG: Crp/Fnr family transcriptional regulator [Labilithrix sp.]|nr:Crp/Fnr family transcriptional regulator [Labilithrix sp.]MBX3225622.1 Crp/Fnr family transcriptional regulator [Labilithrix sp.]
MSIVQDLRSLPLFQGISEARLEQLVATFQTVTHKAGTVLFRPGETATHFELLAKGEVSIEEPRAEQPQAPASVDVPPVRFALRPLAPLGELGALTGLPRSTTATATTDVELLSVKVGDLIGFFEANGDIGFAFYKNLLGLVSDKVRRDRSRIEDMRTNIVRTQKAMKQLREVVLAAAETEISKPVFDTLDTLIDNNRRANYRVSPTASYPAHVRLDDGRVIPVLEVSEGHVKVAGRTQDLTADPTFWAGVLVVPASEILLSGSVLREGEGGVVVKLDKPIEEYKVKLDDYTTRVQLLDFVV